MNSHSLTLEFIFLNIISKIVNCDKWVQWWLLFITIMYFLLEEEFIIDFNKNIISSSTYISDYFSIESRNLELKYVDDQIKNSIQLIQII